MLGALWRRFRLKDPCDAFAIAGADRIAHGRAMDRRSALLEGLDPATGRWLEIGALDKPMLRPPGCRVVYADHATTSDLRAKYAGHALVDPDALADVEIVWEPGKSLREAARGQVFDHAVASHVIEHAPNLLGWLEEIASVLQPRGSLRLAIPDKRYCFDFLRRETGLPEVLDSYLNKRTRPGVRDILDFWGWYRSVDAAAAWRGDYPSLRAFSLDQIPVALGRCRDSLERGGYHDVHCSVFTPHSFAILMLHLAELGLLPFGCTQIRPTAPNQLEFFVHLMRMEPGSEALLSSWRWAVGHTSAETLDRPPVVPLPPAARALPRRLRRLFKRMGSGAFRPQRSAEAEPLPAGGTHSTQNALPSCALLQRSTSSA